MSGRRAGAMQRENRPMRVSSLGSRHPLGVREPATSAGSERVPIAGPWVTDLEIDFVAAAARDDWYQRAGQSVSKFEREFAEYLGLAHAVATPHCTSALHLAYLSLHLGPGDEVIIPEATWVATAAPLWYVGATPSVTVRSTTRASVGCAAAYAFIAVRMPARFG